MRGGVAEDLLLFVVVGVGSFLMIGGWRVDRTHQDTTLVPYRRTVPYRIVPYSTVPYSTVGSTTHNDLYQEKPPKQNNSRNKKNTTTTTTTTTAANTQITNKGTCNNTEGGTDRRTPATRDPYNRTAWAWACVSNTTVQSGQTLN